MYLHVLILWDGLCSSAVPHVLPLQKQLQPQPSRPNRSVLEQCVFHMFQNDFSIHVSMDTEDYSVRERQWVSLDKKRRHLR